MFVYAEDESLLRSFSAERGLRMSFMHSINLSAVDEDYEASDGKLVLRRMYFSQLSSGMPSGYEDGFRVEGGRFVTEPNRRFEQISLRVSPLPGHSLTVGTRTYALVRWAASGATLILRASSL